jgi:predicted PurR-regulated permease PerM
VAILLQQFFSLGDHSEGQNKVNQLLDLVRGVGGRIASIASAFLLALLFSFLIVLDLPRLSASVRSLERSRLDFVYREVAGSIRDFATVLGKSLEAQFVIALVNSFLTALGVSILGLGSSMAFLTVIVFLCSFIPVLGVFISSVPICLIALQASGLTTMMLAILMITVIHLIEGYVLNPRIYGSYMRINPVIVLFILTIGAKLFHIWGLILGVPICTYIFGHVIQRPAPPVPEGEDRADAALIE